MQKTVHIISHSHWDREWYMAFEKHRMKLIDLVDTAMDLFENDPGYQNYHLDGQSIVLDDYLEIKPQNREKVEKFVKEGNFHVGPWYILQDEFLTSGESNVRNLLVGMQEAEAYGGICHMGYFPDAFGNAGQMPQLLKQAGMKAVAFGRGVKPVGFNNAVLGGEYESTYSEMLWESPDGTALPGILFANWYHNGMEIPVEEKAAKEYWDRKLKDAELFASTGQLLFMNGCDHQPVQKDLSAAIETARKLYPDIQFIHSDFETYIDALEKELEEKKIQLSRVKGELISQETDGRWTLVNTCSAHVELKVKNRECETALERLAEPLAVLAFLQGMKHPTEFLRYSWKTLMQNHPHDSICGCSVDEVNREMATRFMKSHQVAEELIANSLNWIGEKIDTSALAADDGRRRYPFVVMNTSGWKRSGVVRVLLNLEQSRNPFLKEGYQEMSALPFRNWCVKNAEGESVLATVADAGVKFGYDLPDDRFRQPYMARQAAVTLEAKEVPAFGYTVYYLEEVSGKAETPGLSAAELSTAGLVPAENGESGMGEKSKTVSLISAPYTMENENLKVEIQPDGSYHLTDKKSGRCYLNIGWFEDAGDVGNEYIFVEAHDYQRVSTLGSKAEIRLAEDTPYRAVYEIVHQIEVPVSACDELEEERRQMADLYRRGASRNEKKVILPVTTRLTLEKSAAGLKAETTIENTAKDHRVRVMIPTGLNAETHFADSVFEVVERKNRHGSAWTNPSGCEHQQNFVAMNDETCGLLVANFGLYEYEILPDPKNTIAVTLLRAVGEMGDWGVFPTPDAQLQGTYTLNYEIVPYQTSERSAAMTEGYQFQAAMQAGQIGLHAGSLPMTKGFLTWEGEGLNLTGFKKAEKSDDIMVRFVNNSRETVVLKLAPQDWFDGAYKSSVIEAEGEALSESNGLYELEIRPFEIATVGLRR
ncbi:MAG: alpha-mannosidase [Lachnospiraceae bacterium]|nr:alpha-mannosidase [Lachnospiraceae bacterium]